MLLTGKSFCQEINVRFLIRSHLLDILVERIGEPGIEEGLMGIVLKALAVECVL